MNITIIGSGNVATVLGQLFKQGNHLINEVVGRNQTAVQQLAEKLNARTCFDNSTINKDSDLYVLTVKDDAVAEVSTRLHLNDKLLVHTCGSVSMNVLASASANYGVLYPLQSLRKELNYQPVIPFLIDGNNEHARTTVSDLAKTISDRVMLANDHTRLQYHLSAIIASNFSNHLFALTKNYCDVNGLDFKLLFPLIEETVNRMQHYDPANIQTGPAIRGDEATMQKHVQLLQAFPELKKIYELMSNSIRHAHQVR